MCNPTPTATVARDIILPGAEAMEEVRVMKSARGRGAALVMRLRTRRLIMPAAVGLRWGMGLMNVLGMRRCLMWLSLGGRKGMGGGVGEG